MIHQKYFILFISLLTYGTQSFAQDNAPDSYTLEECVTYALSHHTDIKNAQLDNKIAKREVKETTAIGLPQINGEVELNHNLAVQQQFIPNEGPFADPTMPSDAVFPIQLGVNYSGMASATLSQLIFDGSYIIGLKAAKTYTQLSEKNITRSKIEVKENVSKAYYAVLVNEQRIKLLKNNREMLDELYEDTQVMYENGYVEEVDLQRIEVNINNLETELRKLKSLVDVSYDLLKFQMNMPLSNEISLTETLESKINEVKSYSPPEVNPAERIEYKQMQVRKELGLLSIKNEQARALPKLSAFGRGGYNNGAIVFSDMTDLGNWKSFGMVGLTLDVPIFSSFQRHQRIEMERMELEKTENEKERLLSSIEMESRQAKSTLRDNKDNLSFHEKNMELAEKVYNVTKTKYEEGMVSNYEVIEAENDMKEALTNYYTAVYEALVARIEYEKTIGNLYNE